MGGDPLQGDSLPRASVTIIQKPRSRQGPRGPRGHAKFSAIVQALLGLAEVLESRIWPQRNTEPTNLSSGIRKSP